MPDFSKDEINALMDFVHTNKDEIEQQKKFYQEYGVELKNTMAVMKAIRKRFWTALIIGAIATYLGITI